MHGEIFTAQGEWNRQQYQDYSKSSSSLGAGCLEHREYIVVRPFRM